jgi:nucleoside-diphosphate-sugar epimerase
VTLRVAVLGGTRFVGRALVEELAEAGHELLVVHRGRHEPADLPPAEHLHVERDELPGRVADLHAFRPDAVVDTAAMTRELAEAALAAAPAHARLLVVSSMDVYRAFSGVWSGRITDPVPLDEESPLRTEPPPDLPPRSAGWDFDPVRYEKLDVERAYLARDATICRLPAVYGEHDYQRREEFVLSRVRAGRERIPVGDGGWLFSRGHVHEIARGLRLAVERDAAAGEVLNLCETRCAPIGLWAEQIVRASGHASELVRVPDTALPRDLAITGSIAQPMLASPAKARRLLGWEHGPVEQAVERSVRWHLEHPPGEVRRAGDFAEDERALAQASAIS